MDSNFYELRLRITELFYYSYIKEKYSFIQCASNCIISYTHVLNKKNINSVNIIFTICSLLLKHENNLNEIRNYVITAIDLYESYNHQEELSREEREVLLAEYEEIKSKIYS